MAGRSHCAVPRMTGPAVEGTWFNRTLESTARLRGEDFDTRKYAFPQDVVLSLLPCWRHLDPEAYRSRIAHLVQEINSMARQEREAKGIKPLGPQGHPCPESLRSARGSEKVAGPSVSRLQARSSQGAVGGVRLVCGSLPGGCREAPEWRPLREISDRELSASSTLRFGRTDLSGRLS